MTYNANIIAKYIITYCSKIGTPISNLKLQKILYYAWVEYFKKTGKELYDNSICAWQLGPVVPDVYFNFCQFGGKAIDRNYDNELDLISTDDHEVISEIVKQYVLYSASRLVDMTHASGGAWDITYKNGAGNKKIIPFHLIKEKECG